MNKPSPKAKLLNMPEEHQAQLAEWLLNGMPYHVAKVEVEKNFGVTASLGAFSGFWQACCSSALIARRSRAVNLSTEVAQEASKHPGQFDKATLDAISQKAFELAVAPGANPKDVKALFMLVLKSNEQGLKQKELDLARRRVELLERTEASTKSVITDTTLSPEEKEKAVKQILGIA